MRINISRIMSTVCEELPPEIKDIIQSFISSEDECSVYEWYNIEPITEDLYYI